MVSFAGLDISRTTSRMKEQVATMQKQLEKAGVVINTGLDSASRHDELTELNSLIRSPSVSVPDKIEYMDSIIVQNMQWGMGRTDKFWNFIFINWRDLYSVWLAFMSFVDSRLQLKYQVHYTESYLALDGHTKQRESERALMADTVLYLMLNPSRYPTVRVIGMVEIEDRIASRYSSPSEDSEQYRRDVYDFGNEVVLQMGWIALNYVFHPDHINPKTVLVFSGGSQQKPPEGQQGLQGSSDFTGARDEPGPGNVPGKIPRQ